jgi:hypothetical protein
LSLLTFAYLFHLDQQVRWTAQAGLMVNWFMTKDPPQFGIMEMAAAALLFMRVVAVLSLWPARWTRCDVC